MRRSTASDTMPAMVAFRSRRLETVFNARIDQLTRDHVQKLVYGQVEEDYDLDFKSHVYDHTRDGKKALATDVAAMANTNGGIIVLGVAENDQGEADALPGVEITDDEKSRIRQIIADWVAPLPEFDLVPVYSACDDPDSADHAGCLVIAVPRSPSAPHAVMINKELRFPRRNGATTRYLREAELAAAYRDRYANRHRQTERCQEVEQAAAATLDLEENRPWLMVSLVPDLAGDMTITRQLHNEIQDAFLNTPFDLLGVLDGPKRVQVGAGYLRVNDGTTSPLARTATMQWHTDGAGTWAARVHDLNEPRQPYARSTDDNGHTLQIAMEEHLVTWILSGLHRLACHAQDRAAAAGTALVRAHLLPISPETPTAIGRIEGIPRSRSPYPVTSPPSPAAITVPLDTLTQVGPDLVSAAAMLATNLAQSYGVLDMPQLDTDGRIHPQSWFRTFQQDVRRWCGEHGIDTGDGQT